MRFIAFLLLVCTVIGCSSVETRTFTITARPENARIEVNGITKCSKTPCTIRTQCAKNWVGIAYAEDGYVRKGPVLRVSAYPTKVEKQTLTVQNKVIDSCDISDGDDVFFDLHLLPIGPTPPNNSTQY